MKFYLFSSFYFAALITDVVTESSVKQQEYKIKDSISDLFDASDVINKMSSKRFKAPVVDFLQEDDHEEFDLADIIALSKAEVSKDIDTYTALEKMEFVDLHNIYRSNLTEPIPNGSDVQYVEWNDVLAWAAYDYLKLCIMSHGWGDNDNMTDKQGQNMYEGSSRNPSRPMWLWYKEYKWFNFFNQTCKKPYPFYMCEHFTQILWHDSHKIGCARKSSCFPKDKSRYLVSCHYYPHGNEKYAGSYIYRYGYPCTRCKSEDGNLCYNNLCVKKRICSDFKLDCECRLACKNCVKPNHKTCKCEPCKSGWDWEDCSFPCMDAYDVLKRTYGACKRSGMASRKGCKQEEFKAQCRRSCGVCQGINLTDTKNLCCGGKMCPMHYTLDESCECQLDCPSPLCMFLPPATLNNTYDIPTTETNFPVDGRPVNDSYIPKRKNAQVVPSQGFQCRAVDMYLICFALVAICLSINV